MLRRDRQAVCATPASLMMEVGIDRTQGGDGTGTRACVCRRRMRRPRDGTGARRLGGRPPDRGAADWTAVGGGARALRRASAGAAVALGSATGTAAGPARHADVTGDADDPRTASYADVTGNADGPPTASYADVTGNADGTSRGPIRAPTGRSLAVCAATGRAAADGPSAASG